MAALTIRKPGLAASATFAESNTSAGGDTIANSGKEFFYVNNTTGAPVNFTVAAAGTCAFGHTGTAHDLIVAVPATTVCLIGPFDPARFNDGNGLVKGTSATVGATVKVAALSTL